VELGVECRRRHHLSVAPEPVVDLGDERVLPPSAGVVHQDGNGTQLGLNLVEQLGGGPGVRQVGLHRSAPGAGLEDLGDGRRGVCGPAPRIGGREGRIVLVYEPEIGEGDVRPEPG
jgi:hypothetical protein